MKNNHGLLIMLHCKENTGYAISSLEDTFYRAALAAGYAEECIFWSYNGLEAPPSSKKINCNYFNPHENVLVPFLLENSIQSVIAFDLGYPAKITKILKNNGVRRIVSYWGASMSSINHGIKLGLKKLEWIIRRHKPDCFIFESEAMRLTATRGRGVPRDRTEVIFLGVDTQLFFPAKGSEEGYAHLTFNIPRNRKIIFYSGHMEERKGVRVIMEAAMYLVSELEIKDVHFLICGNKGDEADVYKSLIAGNEASAHVTFAGYRTDIPRLMRGSYLGVIASTGWDSFTMSSVEMMASGLPLIVSNLQGLSETVENDVNGHLFNPGDSIGLATKIRALIANPGQAKKFSMASRSRAESLFTKELQISRIASILMGSE